MNCITPLIFLLCNFFLDFRLRCILIEQVPSLFPDLIRLRALGDRPVCLLTTIIIRSLNQDNEEVSLSINSEQCAIFLTFKFIATFF